MHARRRSVCSWSRSIVACATSLLILHVLHVGCERRPMHVCFPSSWSTITTIMSDGVSALQEPAHFQRPGPTPWEHLMLTVTIKEPPQGKVFREWDEPKVQIELGVHPRKMALKLVLDSHPHVMIDDTLNPTPSFEQWCQKQMHEGMQTTMTVCTDSLGKGLQQYCTGRGAVQPECTPVQSVDESSMRALNLLLDVEVALDQVTTNGTILETLFINVSHTHPCMYHCALMACMCASADVHADVHRFMWLAECGLLSRPSNDRWWPCGSPHQRPQTKCQSACLHAMSRHMYMRMFFGDSIACQRRYMTEKPPRGASLVMSM